MFVAINNLYCIFKNLDVFLNSKLSFAVFEQGFIITVLLYTQPPKYETQCRVAKINITKFPSSSNVSFKVTKISADSTLELELILASHVVLYH